MSLQSKAKEVKMLQKQEAHGLNCSPEEDFKYFQCNFTISLLSPIWKRALPFI